MSLSFRSPLGRLVALLSVVALAACADTDTPESASPLAPTAPAAASVTAADSTTGEIRTLSDDASPICHGYLERRDEHKAELAQNPGDEDLIEMIAGYNRFLNENCR